MLERIGVDSVVIPEEAMGERLAAVLAKPNVVEIMTLADSFRMVEIRTPKRWQDKTLITSPAGDCKLLADDLIVIAGAIDDIKRLSNKATGKVVAEKIDIL